MFLYRAALSLSSFSFAAGSAAFLALGESAGAPLEWAYLGGAVGLGGALGLVHMYAADIKRVILALYALGAVGSVVAKLALVGGDGMPLPVWVGEHPAAIEWRDKRRLRELCRVGSSSRPDSGALDHALGPERPD